MSNKVKRTVGPVTTSATVGAGVGVALAQLVVLVFPDLAPGEFALSVVLTSLLGLLGGFLVPSQKPAIVTDTADPNVFSGQDNVVEGERVAVPDYHAPAVESDHMEEPPRVVEYGYGPTNGSTPLPRQEEVRRSHA